MITNITKVPMGHRYHAPDVEQYLVDASERTYLVEYQDTYINDLDTLPCWGIWLLDSTTNKADIIARGNTLVEVLAHVGHSKPRNLNPFKE